MDIFAKILLGWGILSVPAALFVGACIRFGTGSDEPSELQRAQQAYDDAVDRGDTRGMRAAFQALHAAKTAQLAAEIGWKGAK